MNEFSTHQLTVQWSSGGESRISEQTRGEICDDVESGGNPFPLHDHFGSLTIGRDGHTVWLNTLGGAYIAGELVDASVARPKTVPASGTVNIASLAPEMQAAVMTLLRGTKR